MTPSGGIGTDGASAAIATPIVPASLALIFAYMAPLVARPIAELTLVPVDLIAAFLLFWLAARRATPEAAPFRTVAHAASQHALR